MKLYAITPTKENDLNKNFDCLDIVEKNNVLNALGEYIKEKYSDKYYVYEFEVNEEICANIFSCFFHGNSNSSWSKNIKFKLHLSLTAERDENEN